MDREEIRPLLTRLTADDGKGNVVADPEFGWNQLQNRLLRDLATTGDQILPIQLVLAVESLRRFRFLTVTEYARHGGARGLERLHIERHAQDACTVSRVKVDKAALLAGLAQLVTDDGTKTRRIPLTELAKTVLGDSSKDSDLEPIVEHLKRERILRRLTDAEGEQVLLHHDYLARGVREAYRNTKPLGRTPARTEPRFPGGSRMEAALADIAAAARPTSIAARPRTDGFHYGPYRRFALLSLLRSVPFNRSRMCRCVGGGIWPWRTTTAIRPRNSWAC
jgi:hypothetical protein